MTTLEQVRAEIENINVDYYKSVNGIDMTECVEDIKRDVFDIIDKYAEQSGWEKMTVPCENCGHDITFKIATIGDCEDCKYKSKAEQEPTGKITNDVWKDFKKRKAIIEQEPTEKITLWGGEQFVSIETYQQVCKERDIAIEQLNELGYELGQKIEPCDDAISRQAVLNTINAMRAACDTNDISDYYILLLEAFKQLLSVRPQEQTGRWIKHNTGHSRYYSCSKCSCLAPNTEVADGVIWKLSKYCPDCGARMESVQNG